MARKKPQSTATAEEPDAEKSAGQKAADRREGWRTPDQLRSEARQLAEHVAELDAIAEVMERKGVSKMKIDGATKFVRGRDLINTYCGKVSLAIRKAKTNA